MMVLVHPRKETTGPRSDLSSHPYNTHKGDSIGVDDDEDSLPPGFPKHLTTGLAWCGSVLSKEETYIHFLTDQDRLEIHAALLYFKSCGLDGDLVTCENFPLPRLEHSLRALAVELHAGKGFFILRGLQPKDYSVEDSMVIFLGLQAYIAEQRARQDGDGNMIVHIISDTAASSDTLRSCHVRHSNSSIAFHTDFNADILAFQTRGAALRGGRCVLSPTHTIYNELVATRPDVIRTLAQPDWPFALPYFHQRPIIFHHDSHIIFSLSPLALLGSAAHPRPSTIPSVTARQHEALDVLNSIAETHRLEFATKPSDIHFVNNLAILHRRDGFVDAGVDSSGGDDGNEHKRHLVRMHLRNERLGWSIPPFLRGDWERAFEREEFADQKWHIVPMPPRFFPLRVDCQ